MSRRTFDQEQSGEPHPAVAPSWKCAAFGCPLAGSAGSHSSWWCYCHHNQDPALTQRITAAIAGHRLLVEVMETAGVLLRNPPRGDRDHTWESSTRSMLAMEGYRLPPENAPDISSLLYGCMQLLSSLVREEVGTTRRGSGRPAPAPHVTPDMVPVASSIADRIAP